VVRTEQEYDAQADMLDEDEPASTNFPTPNFHNPNMSHGMQQSPITPNLNAQQAGLQVQQAQQQQQQEATGGAQYNGLPQQQQQQQQQPNGNVFDPYDPMLDADPFGLSASMHFPTPYSAYDAQR
jgi:hypothetical protein